MGTPSHQLLEYARRLISSEDIVRFAPGDPGYADYVRCLTAVWETCDVPARAHFDLIEPISLTNYSSPESLEEAGRFCRFRIFGNAIAVALLCDGHSADIVHPPNYVLYLLLYDAGIVADPVLTALLPPVCMELHDRLKAGAEEEYPFGLLAFILASLATGMELAHLAPAAATLLEEEGQMRLVFVAERDEFLLGITCFDHFHDGWRRLIRDNVPAEGAPEEFALIRDALQP